MDVGFPIVNVSSPDQGQTGNYLLFLIVHHLHTQLRLKIVDSDGCGNGYWTAKRTGEFFDAQIGGVAL
jgi:hypothetical protein